MCRILREPVEGTPRHVCRKYRVTYRRSDLRVFISKQNVAKQNDLTLESSHLQGATYLTIYFAQKSKRPRRFLEYM